MKKEKQGRTIDSHLKKVMKCVRERGSIGCVKALGSGQGKWLKGKRTLKRKRVEKEGLERFPSDTRRLNEEG